MKKIYTLLITFCFCSFAYAQNTFEKVIDTLSSSFAQCVQITYDGGYVLCGGSILNGNDAVVVKVDSTGTIQWAKNYSGPGVEGAVHIEQTPDSGYIVDGIYDSGLNTKNWLLRLDVNGDTLWTKTIGSGIGSINANQMAVNANFYYGLTGYFNSNPTSHSEAYLIVTDKFGNLINTKVYNTQLGSKSFGINKKGRNFIFTGAYIRSSTLTDLYLVYTDSIGDTIWTRTYDNSSVDCGYAVEQTADSGFIIAGITVNTPYLTYNAYLVKTNSNGDTLWTKMYYSTVESGANSVQQTTDGGFILVGTISPPPTYNGNVYLIKTDGNGDTLWTRQYGGNNRDLGLYVRQTADGGYIVTGTTSLGTGGIYLIKTDSMGNVNSPSGIAEVNNPFSFSVYPNPCIGNFNIQLNGINYKNSLINIYNMFNTKVYSCSINVINSTVPIDLSNLATGMYMVVLDMGEKIVAKKISIQN